MVVKTAAPSMQVRRRHRRVTGHVSIVRSMVMDSSVLI